jgi:osmoprotectant transport system substrate-binding protein
MMTRARSVALIGSACLASCAKARFRGVRIGSSRAPENAMIADIYAASLERAGIPVERLLGLGDPRSVLAAAERAEIDLYPGVGTFALPRGLVQLAASPSNDSPCIVTSQYAAETFWLIRLSKCAAIARQLRFAATPDFVAPGGPLDRLRRAYGGFDFKQIIVRDPGTQTALLNRDEADVANAFTTEAAIGYDQLVILDDDKHFWPVQHIAPIVRTATINAYPRMRDALDRISGKLSQYSLQELNRRREILDLDPRGVADDFVGSVDAVRSSTHP